MRFAYWVFINCILLIALTQASTLSDEVVAKVTVDKSYKRLLLNHCQQCHGENKQEGKFRIDTLEFTIGNIQAAETWQKILNVINSGEMPPEDEAPLAKKAKTDFLDHLANVMVDARKRLSDQGGVITMRRLNRREYRNTLRELLGVEIDVTELPSDSGSGNFDTVGSNLFMSANQFEQYRALGREALEEAIERQEMSKSNEKFRYEAEDTTKKLKEYYQESVDAANRARRWAEAVHQAASKPENAAISAKIRETAKDDQTFRRSWKLIAGAPAPEEFGFNTKENNADRANRAYQYSTPTGIGAQRAYDEYYLKQPHLDTGGYLTIFKLNNYISMMVPFSWKKLSGNYIVRLRVAATDEAPFERRFIEFGNHPRHGQILSTHQVTGTMEHPQIIEIPLTLTRKHTDRNDRTLFIREKGTWDNILQTRRRFAEGKKENGIGPKVAIWVDWMEIERIPSIQNQLPPGLRALDGLLSKDTKESPTVDRVKKILRDFSVVAFRGSEPTEPYLEGLIGIYKRRLESGDKYQDALKHILAIVLSSPKFLYLAEPSDGNERRELTEFELANRLSYFLWSAPPDNRLIELASKGELSKQKVLDNETMRLLDDPRSKEFVTAFTYQWLGLDRLDFFEVDQEKHPRFDNATKLAARDEIYETMAYILRNNAGLTDLLKSDYVVIDPVLSHYYGLKGVSGEGFRCVPLPENSPRGGLLGMAAICLMGGNGEETSPVERGAWVLRKLLNDPPPPAPANVPQLTRLTGKLLTTRERMIAHQEEAQCASCHRKIDPIGFGLENFDAVGAWRTENRYQVKDNQGRPIKGAVKTWAINPVASLYNGPSFNGYFELRDILASKSDNLATSFSEALIEFALGRPVAFSDQALVESLVTQASEKDFAMREFIKALVTSREFQTK